MTTKPAHTLALTRGSLYILEACMQDPGPCTTPAKTVLWARVWDKIRKLNDRTLKVSWAPKGIDAEKPYYREEGETDVTFGKRKEEIEEAFKAWKDEPITLTLNDKYRDACREALKYVTTQRDKARTKMEITLHSADLLIAFGLTEEVDEEPALEAAEATA